MQIFWLASLSKLWAMHANFYRFFGWLTDWIHDKISDDFQSWNEGDVRKFFIIEFRNLANDAIAKVIFNIFLQLFRLSDKRYWSYWKMEEYFRCNPCLIDHLKIVFLIRDFLGVFNSVLV